MSACEVFTEVRTHPVCPACGSKTGVGAIDHLRSERDFKTSWSCKDCRKSIHLRIEMGTLTECSVNPSEYWVKGIALLKLDPQDHPIYFVVAHDDYRPKSGDGETEEERDSSRRFLFEEHSCPTNWLRPILVMDRDDSDPHGLLTYVAWKPMDVSDRSSAQDDRLIDFVKECRDGRV